MSHKSIRLLLENTVKDVRDDIQYSYGTDSDFSRDEEKSFTFVNTNPLTATPAYRSNNGTTNYMKQWNVEMMFAKVDNMSSDRGQYAKILDELDELIDKFINDLNFFQSKSDQIILGNFSQQSFIKGINVLTGFILTFQILANDDFDYCHDC